MNETQTAAFKAAAGNVEPAVLNLLFIGSLIAVLTLWAGWGFVHVYRGYRRLTPYARRCLWCMAS